MSTNIWKGKIFYGRYKKYYENTEDAEQNHMVERFIKIDVAPSNAIDLGCGAGRDTIFLLKNIGQVTSIDREDTKSIIEEKLNEEELKKFKFIYQNFENIKLQHCDLIVSNFSIPFCSKNYFEALWNEIQNSINKGRILCRNLF